MGPDLFIFEVTTRCNLRCQHCYNIWEKPGSSYPKGELSTADTLKMLDRVLDETGANQVTLTGGEPLLRPDLPELVAHLYDRGVTVDLISNGSLMSDAKLETLPADKISMFELPLLSAEAAIFDRMAGQSGAFDKVTVAMAQLKLLGRSVVGVFVATLLNLPTLDETLDLAMALGLDGVMFNRFNPGGRGLENLEKLSASPDALAVALDLCQAKMLEYELPVSCSIPMPECLFDHTRWPDLGFGTCSAGTDSAYFTIDPSGNLRPCNHTATILGNLLEHSFEELVAGETMANFMAARPSFCAGCAEEDTCQGGCKAAAEAACGDLCGLDPYLAANLGRAKKL